MKRSAAIIIKNEEILLLRRIKNGREYFIIPGGRMEEGETPEQTAVREVKEETCLDVEIDYLLTEYEGHYDHEYVFVVKNISGKAKLGGEELEGNCTANFYEIAWVKLAELAGVKLLPEVAKQKILETFGV